MLFWGFILLIAGAVVSLILFLSHLVDLFSQLSTYGFGAYVERFFAPEFGSIDKTLFLIAAGAAILGLVLYVVGRIRNKEDENPLVPVRVSKFFRDTKGEMKKIVWPNVPSVVRNTGVVLAMCAVTGVVIVVIDTVLSLLIDLLQGL